MINDNDKKFKELLEKETNKLLPKILETIQLPASGYIRQSQLIPDILPFSSSTLWRLVRTGKFPRPIKLSKRVTVWKAHDVKIWLENLQVNSVY